MSVNRKQLSKRIRFEVFKRDRFTCQYCGRHPPDAILHADHILAVANGGTNDIDNLVTACDTCNLGKSDVLLSVVPKSLAERAAEVEEREEQLEGYQSVLRAKRERLDRETWDILRLLYPEAKRVANDEFSSTKRFVERLGYEDVHDAAERALGADIPGRRVFRYFCGICWNRIREGQQP